MAGAGLLTVRGRFGPLLPRILRVRNSLGQGVEVLGAVHGHHQGARRYTQLRDNSRQLALARPLLQRQQEHGWQYGGARGLGWVPALLSRLLKVRYLLLGGAVGGGGALARQYDEWKDGLPDSDWIKKMMPEVDLDKFRNSLLGLKDQVKVSCHGF